MPSCWPPVAWPSLPCSTSCSDPACRIRKTGRPPVSVPVDVLFCARRPARSMRPAKTCPSADRTAGGQRRWHPDSTQGRTGEGGEGIAPSRLYQPAGGHHCQGGARKRHRPVTTGRAADVPTRCVTPTGQLFPAGRVGWTAASLTTGTREKEAPFPPRTLQDGAP